jgi:hypothetical protein
LEAQTIQDSSVLILKQINEELRDEITLLQHKL